MTETENLDPVIYICSDSPSLSSQKNCNVNAITFQRARSVFVFIFH